MTVLRINAKKLTTSVNRFWMFCNLSKLHENQTNWISLVVSRNTVDVLTGNGSLGRNGMDAGISRNFVTLLGISFRGGILANLGEGQLLQIVAAGRNTKCESKPW